MICLIFAGLMGLVIFLWWREKKYLKKKTSETMSGEVWKDMEVEREEALRKRRLFRKAMDNASKTLP
ncbi:MAG: hypothetical protein Q7T03_05535 [Deltaproteobacteria bacterium]|nr:hypothetical protein [Deltaproteobacteria bacterium]